MIKCILPVGQLAPNVLMAVDRYASQLARMLEWAAPAYLNMEVQDFFHERASIVCRSDRRMIVAFGCVLGMVCIQSA